MQVTTHLNTENPHNSEFASTVCTRYYSSSVLRAQPAISPMPAMLFLSLLPHLSGNPHMTISPILFPYSCISSSSSFLPNPPKNPIQNYPPSSLPIASTINPNFPVSSEPKSHSAAAIKVPTAPWMKGPLLLQPDEVLDFSNPNAKKSFHKGQVEHSDKALAEGESGVRGKKAMRKIVESIEKLQKGQNSTDTPMVSAEVEFRDSLERLKEDGDFRTCRRMPWEKDEKMVFRRTKKEKAMTAADLTLDMLLLERLRREAARMRTWVKAKKAGVTQAVVDEIKRIWKRNELAMVKFDVPLCRNMDRAQEIVEIKTGGLVVWSKKDTLVIYRGHNHQFTPKVSQRIYTCYSQSQKSNHSEINWVQSETKDDLYWVKSSQTSTHDLLSCKADHKDSIATGIHHKDVNCQTVSGSLYEREADRLLEGLGPRFIDWWMHKPLPVDADLLPEVVPGFKPPFRLCPPYANLKLTDNELTYLRKVAHPLPTHFVLGRNKRLQGLAAAVLKLWEKSLIAKIAVKYGIPNTDNEKMANELKCLTGGTLLLRNKFFIILYRGKDFLPRRVAALVEKREADLKSCELHEEVTRMKAVESFSASHESQQKTSTSGTLTEFKKIQTKLGDVENIHVDLNVQLEAEIERMERELRKEERKAFILNSKIEISARELAKLNAAWTPAEQDADTETMTEEERECFRKIGLKMGSCLVLGRRGIFDGVVEGLHQHWKHKEVVKVITMQRVFSPVIYTAKLLESESGGVVVSVDKIKEGHAIIIYRGKNYRRPLKRVSKNLLTKREALRRSLEMQRIGSLKFFAHQRQQRISDLKIKLADLQQRKEIEQKEKENK